MKQQQVKIIIKGNNMTLIYTPQQGRFFVPNQLLEKANPEHLNKVPEIKTYRRYGTGKYCPVWVEGDLMHLDRAYRQMIFFEMEGTHSYKNQDYPIAINFKVLNSKPAEPVKVYNVNGLFPKEINWVIPNLTDPKLKALEKENNDIYSLLDVYYCFTNEAVEKFEPVYIQVQLKLKENLKKWKDNQCLNIGDLVHGKEVVDIRKNPNETATFVIRNNEKDFGYVHENYIDSLLNEKIPEYIDDVKINMWGNLQYHYNNKWYDDLDDIHVNVDF